MPNTPSKRDQNKHKQALPNIPEEVRELIPADILNSLPKEQIGRIIACAQSFSGPLPPPELMAQYGEVKSDFPERIARMAEEHNSSDVLTKNRISFAMSFSTIAGTIFSFLLGAGSIGAGIWLATLGYSGSSITAIIAGFAPIIIASLSNLTKK